MRVRLTRAADREIDEILRWTAEKFGVPAARRYHLGILRVLDLIGDAPSIATSIGKGMRAHPYQSHIIIYRERGGEIEVLAVRHGRSNWRGHL